MLIYSKALLTEQAKIFKALGHPTRLIMVHSLQSGEKCVCELQELIGDDISTISKHLSVLKEAGIVAVEKRGTNVYYRLILCCLETFLSCTAETVRRRLSEQMEELKK